MTEMAQSLIFQYAFILCLLVGSVHLLQSPKPHLVYVLVDDWGFSEVGFKNPALKTPNFDNLAKNGLILDRHYVFKFCSPSRASLLSGRWPHHVHQFNLHPNVIVGLNINMTLLPAKLKQAGYSTHMVGKWHEGFFDPAYLPVNRGFDTSSGFLNGGEDHFNEKRECAVDFWKNNDVDARNGTYDAYVYRDDLTEILDNHDSSKPFFLYLPLHNIHDPLEAPQEWLDIYNENSTCSTRRTIQAMVSVADNVTGHVVELLKKKDMWKDTFIVVSADNGGAQCQSSNYPLKGAKSTFFEGGVRALAFASGGFLPEKMVSKTSETFIHIADWYPTFCKLAGVDPSDSGDGKFPVDGLDVWPIITGENTTTPHDEIMLAYNDTYHSGAMISGEYKLIIGNQSRTGKSGCDALMWSPINYPCQNGTEGEDCDPYCLYNIVKDPGEKNELSKMEPEILKQMLARYHKHDSETGIHRVVRRDDLKDVCKYMAEHGEYWRPWKNVKN